MVSQRTLGFLFNLLITSTWLIVFVAIAINSREQGYDAIGNYGVNSAKAVLNWKYKTVQGLSSIWFEGWEQIQSFYVRMAIASFLSGILLTILVQSSLNYLKTSKEQKEQPTLPSASNHKEEQEP